MIALKIFEGKTSEDTDQVWGLKIRITDVLKSDMRGSDEKIKKSYFYNYDG